ncbi:LiaF transmembrane domain-containing protein [Hufsiella ginkgonis]|uniref:LiaF transmembrane domain-containing protein n=1 Tax=Hufsiella ginkgonis TaxID=2695274 RepID=A0A7K1XT98_9SPHI|nr:LiaF domain-containing protein [Hufsiella ginkgonis]MXV14182.1 hypothetical protein [Hufsiella ginkgonis]
MTNIQHKNSRSGKMFAGLILIIWGSVYMLRQVGVLLPGWVLSWGTFWIALGLYTGSKSQFRKPAPIIMIAVGCLLVLNRMVPNMDLDNLIFPVILITAGGFLIMGRNKEGWKHQFKKSPVDWDTQAPAPGAQPGDSGQDTEHFGSSEYGNSFSAFGKQKGAFSTEDYIDTVSVFGAVKKNMVSKNFKGGEIVNFMGGAEINLIQADFQGRIELDVTQVFGGCKIIVPPHWQIHSEMAAIFGGVEDKRPLHPDSAISDKVLVIKGTSIFGGIDIRSF